MDPTEFCLDPSGSYKYHKKICKDPERCLKDLCKYLKGSHIGGLMKGPEGSSQGFCTDLPGS